jgi:hypothetical protein
MYRWRLQHTTSAWASGGPAGGRCEAALPERAGTAPQHFRQLVEPGCHRSAVYFREEAPPQLNEAMARIA